MGIPSVQPAPVPPSAEATRPPKADRRYFWALALTLGAVLLLIEVRHPYFFLQDDNRDAGVACLAHNFRALLSGQVAQFNFHQYSGEPWLSSGWTTVLFPPSYLAAGLSLALFGHYFATMDILAMLLILTGGLGWMAFFRRAGLGAQAGWWGALTCSLNSFLIYGGSSWMCTPALGAFMPWMFALTIDQVERPSRWNMAALVTARLLLFLFGYPQFFIYAAAFEGCVFLTAAWARHKTDTRAWLRASLRYTWGWICVTLLSAPLLLPMWRQVSASVDRQSALPLARLTQHGITLKVWLTGLLFPFSRATTTYIAESLPYLGHIGYVTIPLVCLAVVFLLSRRLQGAHRRYSLLLLSLALVTLLAAMNVLSGLLHHLPIVNRFQWPFKNLLFSNFFAIGAAAVALDHLLKSFQERPAAKLLFPAIAIFTAGNFLALYLLSTPKPFRTHFDPIPLQEPLRNQLVDGKIFSFGLALGDPRPAYVLGFNYATLWGLYHFAGYDPMVPRANYERALGLSYAAVYMNRAETLPLPWLRQWGVKWYVVTPTRPDATAFLQQQGLRVFHQDPNRTVYVDDLSRPMAFWQDGRAGTIPYRTDTNSIRLAAASSAPGRLVVNFVWNPFFSASVDDRPARLWANELGQMSLDVPAGSHTIVIRYADPYFEQGVWIFVITILVIGLRSFLSARRASGQHAGGQRPAS